MDRISEIQARLAAINTEMDSAEGEAFTALETEARNLMTEMEGLKATIEARKKLRDDIARGAGNPMPGAAPAAKQTDAQKAADQFRSTNRMTIPGEEARALLISSGQLIKPDKHRTELEDAPGVKVSSIVDLIHIEDCQGMSSYTVPYVVSDADAADNHTEGQAGTVKELAVFDYKTINPTDVIVLGQVSKQAKKQTNVKYAEKVRSEAHLALRKKAVVLTNAALKASDLVKEITATAGKIDATTLRNLVLQYGDDDSAFGPAYLALNKKDLIAFGDVRGTNEKKAIYEITPNAANPNTGTIKEGGLTVPYVLDSGLAALSDSGASGRTMFYGNFQKVHMAMFSDYEVKVSEDFAFDKLMDTVRGDLEAGVDVVAKHALLALTV